MKFEKVLWVKFGWSELYSGGPVDEKYTNNKGYEAWNFKLQPDGYYHCCALPLGKSGSSPFNKDPKGWTVICLSKKPKETGIYIVGWYEDAELLGGYKKHKIDGEDFLYNIRSKKAYLVPVGERGNPFSHNSVTRSFSYLRGPDINIDENKKKVFIILKKNISTLLDKAIKNPTKEKIKKAMGEKGDIYFPYGTAEHRKRVEDAAVSFVKKHYKEKGYKIKSRELERNVHYDLDIISKNNGKICYKVEVKGTAGQEERFFITRGEYNCMNENKKKWQLAIVTNALKEKNLEFYTANEVKEKFSFEPLAYGAQLKNK